MRSQITLFSLFLFCCGAFAQNDYFQQHVDYKIDVTLDDEAHTLSGNAQITYQNNAPTPLSEVYFHLWGNAYQSKNSAFAKQQLQQGSRKFYFAKASEMGGYEEIDFRQGEKKLQFKYDKAHRDIVKVQLPTPLPSGESTTFEIPFKLKIPKSFSRLGHVGTSYQMTQWYPKPAVYDKNGWHPMPYLDMGEFYSEFGSFEVTITLPDNYVVAATGTLETESEIEFINSKVAETQELIKNGFDDDLSFPASSKTMKTIRYTADKVHDFAWFADKRFHVVKDVTEIAAHKIISTYAYFTNQQADMWIRGAEYCARAVKHYSTHVGEYPWAHATAVQSALSAGAGMEYPMITVIGRAGNAKSLDRVITHEVGHNWFYGILGTNERIHPWFDEGLNTYYENRYMRKYYEGDDEFDIPKFFKNSSRVGVNEIGCLYHDRRHLDQAPDSHSNDFVSLNYGLAAYVKPGRSLRLLEKYIGTELYDKAMKQFYSDWKFKHPQPSDYQRSMEQTTGKDLSWLFDGLLYSNKKTDYVLAKAKETAEGYQLDIHNHGELGTPFPVQGISEGEVVMEKWYDGFEDDQQLDFPKGAYDKIVIDHELVTLDVQRKNNQLKTSGAFKKLEPLQLKFLGGLENPERTRINFLPALAANAYDGLMLGAAFYSNPVPSRNFEYYLAPMYATRSRNLAGMGNLRFQKYRRTGVIHRMALDLGAKAFGYQYNDTYDAFSDYLRLSAKATIGLRKSKATSPVSQELSFRYINVRQNNVKGINAADGIFEYDNPTYYVNDLQYLVKSRHALRPFRLSANVQQGAGFIKTFAKLNQKFVFSPKGDRFQINLFGGWMNSDEKDGSIPPNIAFQVNGRNGGGQFQRDYMFDQLLFERNAGEGFGYRQLSDQDANLKTLAGFGGVSDWMVGIGLRTGIPNPLPIEPYFDTAIYPSPDGSTNFIYSGGVAVMILRNIFEIYVPLLESEDITSKLFYKTNPGFFQRISFKLDLMKLNPWDLINNAQLF